MLVSIFEVVIHYSQMSIKCICCFRDDNLVPDGKQVEKACLFVEEESQNDGLLRRDAQRRQGQRWIRWQWRRRRRWPRVRHPFVAMYRKRPYGESGSARFRRPVRRRDRGSGSPEAWQQIQLQLTHRCAQK